MYKLEWVHLQWINTKMNRPRKHPYNFQLFLKDAEGIAQTYNSNQSSSGNADMPKYIW